MSKLNVISQFFSPPINIFHHVLLIIVFIYFSVRDCCYCDSEARYNNELLSHIMQEHSYSLYQCSYCFYRSIEVDNMILHYQSLHPMEKPEILICENGHDVEFGQQDHEILSYECEKNIDKIECGQGTWRNNLVLGTIF